MFLAKQMQSCAKQESTTISFFKFCSIIVDGAEQLAFGLPRFVTKTKDVRYRTMKISLTALLDHSKLNRLHLCTMTEEHETGAKHVVETIL